MPRNLHTLCLACAVLLLSLSEARAQQPLDDWPDWVQKRMQDEAGKLTFSRVDVPDDTVTVSLPGKPDAPQAIDDGWYLSTDIDAGSPLECYVVLGARDLATVTHTMAKISSEAVAAQHGEISQRYFHFVDGGEVTGMPYLALEWIYTIKNADEQLLVGFTKVRAATKGQRTFVCTHNNLGYRDTFAKAFDGFVANASIPDATRAPYYEEIVKVDMNGIGSGIVYVAYFPPDSTNNENLTEIRISESALMPVDASTVMTSDSTSVTLEDPAGVVDSAVEIAVENGEITRDLDLWRDEEKDFNWAVSGTLQGKEIAAEIDGDLKPAGALRQLEMAREVFAEGGNSVDALVWIPSADPTRFLTATMTRDDAETAQQAILQLGPLSYVGRFDDDGNMYDATMSIGPIKIGMERIWSHGSLRQ